MKKYLLLLFFVIVMGCSDDAPTGTNPIPSASRNIADYIYSGKVGTEYWIREKISATDTNNNTTVHRIDTIATRIIDRNFNHPLFGSCIQTLDLYPHLGYSLRDTVYYRFRNDTIHVSYSSVYAPNPKLIEVLRAPLQKGAKTMTAGEEAEITDMDVPITTSAGTFSAIVVKASQKHQTTESQEYETENVYYLVEKAMFARIVERRTTNYQQSGKKSISLKEYELITIKNAQ